MKILNPQLALRNLLTLISFCLLSLSLIAEEIDVLILYTDAVETYHGGESGTYAHLLSVFASANEVFEKSNIDIILNLVHSEKTDYLESYTSFAEDLQFLTGEEDGEMDSVHILREQWGADLVCLFRKGIVDDTSGIAWILEAMDGRADLGFSVVSTEAAVSQTFVHELGHNLGAAHDRDHASSEGLFSYSFGFKPIISGREYRTVMAYAPGQQIPYFSNPSIFYGGKPIGVEEGFLDEADNSKTLNQSCSVVANYSQGKELFPHIFNQSKDIQTIVETTVEIGFEFSSIPGESIRWFKERSGEEVYELIEETSPYLSVYVSEVGTNRYWAELRNENGIVKSRVFSVTGVALPSGNAEVDQEQGLTQFYYEGHSIDRWQEIVFDQPYLDSIELPVFAVGMPSAFILALYDWEGALVSKYEITATETGWYHVSFGLWVVPGQKYRLAQINVGDASNYFSWLWNQGSDPYQPGSSSLGPDSDFAFVTYFQNTGEEYAEFGTSAIEVGSEQTTYELNVRSNTSWTISPNVNWIKAFPNAGSGNGTLKVTVDKNPNPDQREGLLSSTMDTHQIVQYSEQGFIDLEHSILEIEASDSASFVLFKNGDLWASGYDRYGRLGVGDFRENPYLPSFESFYHPHKIAMDVVDVSSSNTHTLFVTRTGELWGIGGDFYGSLGGVVDSPDNYTFSPIKIAENVKSATAGINTTHFIDTQNRLWAMGSNSNKCLGYSSIYDQYDPVEIDSNVRSVVRSGRSTMYLKYDGSVWAVGSNSGGILGTGDKWDKGIPVKVFNSGVEKIILASSSSYFLKSDNTLWAAGNNPFLSDWYGEDGLSPYLLMEHVRNTDAWGACCFVINENGVLFSIGSNTEGELGIGSRTNQYAFRPVAENVKSVSAGANYSLFVTEDGSMWAMGKNADDQLLNGNGISTTLPVRINFWETLFSPDLQTIQCSIESNREWSVQTDADWINVSTVRETGNGLLNIQIEENETPSHRVGSVWIGNQLKRIEQKGSRPILSIENRYRPAAVSDDSMAFIDAQKDLWVASKEEPGEYLSRDYIHRPLRPFFLFAQVDSVSCGSQHTLFVTQDRRLWGFGSNSYGQMGLGEPIDVGYSFKQPKLISSDIVDVAAAGSNSFFITESGDLYGMGQNESNEISYVDGEVFTPNLMDSDVFKVIPCRGGYTLYLKTNGDLMLQGSATVDGFLPRTMEKPSEAVLLETHVVDAAIEGGLIYYIKSDQQMWRSGFVPQDRDDEPGYTRSNNSVTNPYPLGFKAFQIISGNSHSVAQTLDGLWWISGDNNVQQTGIVGDIEDGSWQEIGSAYKRTWVDKNNSFFWNEEGVLFVSGYNLDGRLLTGDTENNSLVQIDLDSVFSDDPSLLNNFDATAMDKNRVLLQWDNVDLEENFVVWIRSNSDWETIAELLPGTLYYVVEGMQAGDEVDFKVEARNRHGSSFSEMISVQMDPPEGPYTAIWNPIVQIDSGNDFSVFLTRDGVLWGAGKNTNGALGTKYTYSQPVPWIVDVDVKAVQTGNNYTAFLKANGELWGLGSNLFGVLTQPVAGSFNEPVFIAKNVVRFFAGAWNLLYIKEDQSLWGTGRNNYGQLGVGNTELSMDARKIMDDIVDVGVGGAHSLFLKSNGDLWGVGVNNYSQLQPTGDSYSSPVFIRSGVKSVHCNEGTSLFVTDEDDLFGMGYNGRKELGILFDFVERNPVLIASGIKKVRSGPYTNMLLWDNGVLRRTESAVIVDDNVADIFVGNQNCYYTKYDGTLWGIGENSMGQMGNGDVTDITETQELGNLLRPLLDLNPSYAKSYLLPLISNQSWSAYTNSSWIHLVSESVGENSDTLLFEIDRNDSEVERTSTVFLNEMPFEIYQSGEATTSYPSRFIGSDAGHFQIEIESVEGWQTETFSSWFEVSPRESNGPGTLNVTIQSNQTEFPRKGLILINNVPCRIVQSENVLHSEVSTVNETSIEFKWNSIPGVRYQVQSNSSLLNTDWTDVGYPIVSIGHHSSVVVDRSDDLSPLFYRVKTLGD